jgi:hypothetical protein
MTRPTALAAALLLALGLGTAPARAANIDTTGSDTGTLFSFGVPASTTMGQTFAPDATQTQLTGFSLFLRGLNNGQGPLALRGYLATWTGIGNGPGHAGTVLYASDTRTMNGAGTLQEFVFTLSQALVAGQQYVAFLSVAGLDEPGESNFGMPKAGDTLGGSARMVWADLDEAGLTNADWRGLARGDAWFKASFATGPDGGALPGQTAVPAPAALGLFGVALLGLGLVRRRG